MGKLEIFLVSVGMLLLITILGFPVGERVYQNWGRRLIYSNQSKITPYPGSGEITETINDSIFVIPKGIGKPAILRADKKQDFLNDQYITYDIPAQTWPKYIVGKFDSWESIEGSTDVYMLAKNPLTKIVNRFRVSFEKSELFENNVTIIATEVVGLRLNQEEKNKLAKSAKPELSDVTFNNLKNIIQKGDIVILVPFFSPPEMAKRDSDNNYLVSWIIIRRVKGVIFLE